MYICVYMGWKAPCKSIKASMLQYNCTWQCTMHCNNCNNCKLRSTSTLFLGGFQIIDNDLTLCVLNMNLLFAGYHLKLNSEARQKLYIIEIELNSERKKNIVWQIWMILIGQTGINLYSIFCTAVCGKLYHPELWRNLIWECTLIGK